MASVVKGEPQVVLTTDASGAWGCGAYTSTGLWFQLKFPDSWSDSHYSEGAAADCYGSGRAVAPLERCNGVLQMRQHGSSCNHELW